MLDSRGYRLRWCVALAAAIALLVAGSTSAPPATAPMELAPLPPLPPELVMHAGVHFAGPGEFATLKQLDLEFAIVDFAQDQPDTWNEALERAAAAGIKLIAGIYPPPYARSRSGTWEITADGIRFLNTLQAHANAVMAVFVYNEPYYTDPNPNGRRYECGFYSADDLRKLRGKIRSVWPEAQIYHDLGDPSAWAPGSEYWQEHQSCIRDKYQDQSEVADYVGIWEYPFQTRTGYRREDSLRLLKRELAFVNTSMQPARPVALIQAFSSKSLGFYFPTKTEFRDWSCAVRQLGFEFGSWYPWRQPAEYEDFLSNHPDYWTLTAAEGCR